MNSKSFLSISVCYNNLQSEFQAQKTILLQATINVQKEKFGDNSLNQKSKSFAVTYGIILQRGKECSKCSDSVKTTELPISKMAMAAH